MSKHSGYHEKMIYVKCSEPKNRGLSMDLHFEFTKTSLGVLVLLKRGLFLNPRNLKTCHVCRRVIFLSVYQQMLPSQFWFCRVRIYVQSSVWAAVTLTKDSAEDRWVVGLKWNVSIKFRQTAESWKHSSVGMDRVRVESWAVHYVYERPTKIVIGCIGSCKC